MKKILLTLDDGRVFSILTEDVAKHRAEFFAKFGPNITYENEFQHGMQNNDALKDWLEKGLHWFECNPVLHYDPKSRAPEDCHVCVIDVVEE
jgi:hypothetical protein